MIFFFLDTVDILLIYTRNSITFFFLLLQNLMIALHSKEDHLKQGKRIDTSKNVSDICKVVVQ